MKQLLLLTLSILLLFNSNSFAAKNAVRLSAEFPRLISYEYERKILIPGLRAFINYGSADVTIDDDETSIDGMNLGIRYKIPFLFYVGVGYSNNNFDYSYTADVSSGSISAGQEVSVDGSISGLYTEIGKEFGLGPVLIGGRVTATFGSPSYTATTDGIEVSDEDVDSGLADINILPGAALYVGIRF